MKQYTLFFLFLFQSDQCSFQMALDFGINLVGNIVKNAAETKMRTEGYKQEVIQGLKEISNITEKEAFKTKNLQKISLIKNETIRKIDKYMSELNLTIKPLQEVAYTSYKNFINAAKLFLKKYNTFKTNNKNINNISTYVKIGLYEIRNTYSKYIYLRKNYNSQLQKINQTIQSNNSVSIFNQANENPEFIDFSFNIEDEMNKIEELISKYDEQVDIYIKEQAMLESNNSSAFSSITDKIIDRIGVIETQESSKDISNQSVKFYDLDNPLEIFKSKLFVAFNKFDLENSSMEALLYKITVILDISTNKMNKISSLITESSNNPSYKVENFLEELKNKFVTTKEKIGQAEKEYINEITKKNNDFFTLFGKIKDYLITIKNKNERQVVKQNSSFLNSLFKPLIPDGQNVTIPITIKQQLTAIQNIVEIRKEQITNATASKTTTKNEENEKLSFENVKEVFRKTTKNMYDYYNYFQIKNRLIENDCVQIGYINEEVINNIEQIDKIYNLVKSKLLKNTTAVKKKIESSTKQTPKTTDKIPKEIPSKKQKTKPTDTITQEINNLLRQKQKIDIKQDLFSNVYQNPIKKQNKNKNASHQNSQRNEHKKFKQLKTPKNESSVQVNTPKSNNSIESIKKPQKNSDQGSHLKEKSISKKSKNKKKVRGK